MAEEQILNTGIQFEDIVPWVNEQGDTGLTSRLKLKRNFDKIKAWMDAQGNAATQQWVDDNYLTKDFFSAIFQLQDSQGNAILPNTATEAKDRLKILVGAYTEQYLSALGLNDDQPACSSTLAGLLDVELSTPTNGQALVYDAATHKWTNGTIQAGTDMATVWTALADTTTEQISATHLTTALSGYATQIWVQQQGYLTQHQSLSGYATQSWVDDNYVSISFFERLFNAYNGDTKVSPNSTATIDNIKAMFGFWTEQYISALGKGEDESHEIGVLNDLNDVNITNAVANQILVYDGTHWRNQNQQSVYELPAATTTALGGVKVGTTLAIASGVLNLPTTGVTAGTYKRVTVDAYGRVTSGDNSDTDTNTWRNIYVGGASKVGTGIDTKAINFKAGSNVSISYVAAGTGSGQSGSANYFDVVISATDTTYSAATQSVAGLMSAADKKKLDGVAENANNYSLPLAASGTRGGVQIGYSETNSGTSTDRNYAVQLSSEKMYVNVPWVNTWRGIQNNLTSDSTTDSLSAAQGKALKGYIDMLNGYFSNGVANSAAKLTTVSKTAWGQTFWTSGGVPTSISGALSSVTNITMSGFIKIGDAYLTYDSTNNAIRVSKNADGTGAVNFYAIGGVSALGQSADGSAGVGDVTWALLASSSDTRQIALSHLTTALGSYATQSWVDGHFGYTTSGKNYAVKLDTNGNAYVNVPWEAGTGTVTSVKVGSTTYTPTAGVISLPAYPTVPTKVSQLTNDSGYITGYTDTKNTAGTTNKAATKLYIVGAESQAANPQTYSNVNVYIGTDNCLYSNNTKVLTNHQSVTNKGATLSWGSAVTVATIGSTDIKVSLPANPNTNTTYTFATGDANGQIKVTPSSGNAYNVSVKGLGSNAYTSTAYLPLSGGTMTGGITCATSGANLKWGNITIYGGGSNGGINSIYIGDDVTIGDCNVAGSFGMKSTSTNAGFRFFNSSGNSIGGIQSTAGVLQWIDSAGTAYNILDASNSSVSKSGETLTVKINGTSQSLTNTNTTYSAGKGLRLSGTQFISDAPRVAKDSKAFGGAYTWIMEEYTAGANYNLPSNAWYHIMSTQGADTAYGTQLALGMTTAAAYYRVYSGGSWGNWQSIINTWRGIQNNLTSQSTTDSLSAYQGYLLANGSARDNTKLPLSGGNMTGHIYLTGSNASSSTANTSQIIFGTSSSQHVALTANNNAFIINPSSSNAASQVIIGVNGNNTYFMSGNVGIGTINPQRKLHVAGDVYANNYVTPTTDGAYLELGNIRLVFDQSNNAIKVVKYDGTAANFYATGGISALGAGSESGGGGGDVTWALLASQATGGRTIHSSYISSTLSNYATVSSLSNYATVSMLSNYATVSTLSNYATVSSLGGYMQVTPTNGARNANVIYDAGLYELSGGSSNLPFGAQYGIILSLPYRNAYGNTSTDFSTQIAIPNGDDSSYPNSMFYRTSLSSSWNAWQRVQNVSMSDVRLKTILSNPTFGIEQIANAPIIRYLWSKEGYGDKKVHIGSTAQYWINVANEFVDKEFDGYYSLQYGVAALISAITIARKVMTHEEKIALLETRVSALEKENGEQEMLINSLQEELAKFKEA